MMRSLYSGVSGLQNHQTRMDVVGNNIANVNTHGFKKGRVTFQDMLSQTLSGAARPQDEKGGVNPKQVGLGMSVAAIDTIHTQGAVQVTGVNTDMSILGEGFFVLSEGEKLTYTRSGAFSIDKNGTLVNPASGLKVQGWQARPDENNENVVTTSGQIEDIVIPVGDKDPAHATNNIFYKSNLQKTGDLHQADIQVYDSTGVTRQLRTTFTRDPENINIWNLTIDVPDATEGSVIASVGDNETSEANTIQLIFNDNGSLVSIDDGSGGTLAAGDLITNLDFTYPGTGGEVTQNISLHLGTSGIFDGVTQFNTPSTTKAVEQDGYNMGELEGFKIDDIGQITGVYTNGNIKLLGQVALAKFNNVGGLEKVGDTMFAESNNSGLANIGQAGLSGRGKIRAGALEMSNVDLAEQFTDMIVTQRGFQANSRSITTSDQMLQELLTLKR